MPSVVVGNTSTVILSRADRKRRRVIFVNISAGDITLAQENPCFLYQNIVLRPNGSVTDEPDPTGYMYQGIWTAICAAGVKI
jgi:hypothetical protein